MNLPTDDYEILHQGRYIRMVRRNGWEYIEQAGASGVVVLVAVTEDRRLLLVEQFRTPLQSQVIELPAGLVGDRPGFGDESFETAGLRELEEETGYTAESLSPLLAGPYSPGRSNAFYTFMRARGLRQISEGGGDEHEEIQVHRVPLDQIELWLADQVAQGRLVDPKIYAALYFIGKESTTRP